MKKSNGLSVNVKNTGVMIQKLDKNRAHSLRIAKIRELTKIRQNNIEPSARVAKIRELR